MMQANDFRCQLDNKMIDQDVSGSHFPNEISKHTHTHTHNKLRKVASLELLQTVKNKHLTTESPTKKSPHPKQWEMS